MQYWYNIATKQIETTGDDISRAHNLMGPYPSRAEAEQALETAAGRTEQWEADEEEERRRRIEDRGLDPDEEDRTDA